MTMSCASCCPHSTCQKSLSFWALSLEWQLMLHSRILPSAGSLNKGKKYWIITSNALSFTSSTLVHLIVNEIEFPPTLLDRHQMNTFLKHF